ncbi:MAG: UDP-4-amino-4,6-dideoxy-N-acetyl-beta-L-altrosamine transaminase [Halothiobacillaceae bacterium]
MIPYGRQDIQPEDIAAVVEVLRSDYLTQGPVVPRFEQAVADYCGAGHAVAVNSATSALHIACLALGLGEGDWLWTSPITFVASANAGRYCGARVDFVDIDPQTCNMSVEVLKSRLEQAERDGKLPKVVMPVHFAGQPCDMPAIAELARRYGFRVIEDASHAIGARYGNIKVGACAHSDITVFSFHPVKIITTGEGGLATTNDPQLARHMERLRSHGITRDPAEMRGEPDGPWYYQQIELGFNYRMTEMQAALGLQQLERLDTYVVRRNELAEQYDQALADLPVVTPWQNPESWSARHLYPVRITSAARRSRREVFDGLREQGIGVNVHYIPVHKQPDYQGLGYPLAACPAAEAYYSEAVSLPLFPALTTEHQEKVVTTLRELVQ